MAGVFTKLQDIVEGYDWEGIKQFCLNNVRTTLVFGVSVTAFWLMFRKPRGIPPGPWFTLPVIGDILQLDGDDLRIPLRRLRKQYGDIFSFYMGQRLVICMNGYEMIKEALVKNGDVFSDRPDMYVYNLFFKHKGISLASGSLWKDQRKFTMATLREFGFGKPILEDKIKEEIEEYISVLTEYSGQPYDMRRLTQQAVANIIASLVFGQRFKYEDKNFQTFGRKTDENFEIFGNGAISNFIPYLHHLPGDLFKIQKLLGNLNFIQNKIVDPAINEHKANFDENDTRDFISCYLKEMKRNEGKQSSVDAENLPLSIMDLFTAGSETTSTTILWAILYFLHHPDIQARCYKEVQDVVGSGRLPSLKDRDSMPYTQAVILEVLRIVNIVLTNVPHAATNDVVFRGYFIPKGALILPNLDSVLSDEDVWGDPESFRPERFLNEKNQIVQREEFIPFSAGRRVCLGEALARMELFLFISSLVQRFEFKPVDPNNLPSLKGTFGITHAPYHYDAIPISRDEL